MRANVLGAINCRKIDELIEKYKKETKNRPRYLIMNNWTFDGLKSVTKNELGEFIKHRNDKWVIHNAYKGISIAINEAIEDGEVEVI